MARGVGARAVALTGPRSFDTEAAAARMTTSADIIAAEAGELYSPTPVEEIRYLPRDDLAPLMASEEMIAQRLNPHEIMGCVSAGIFVTAWGVPTTIGLVSTRQPGNTTTRCGNTGTTARRRT